MGLYFYDTEFIEDGRTIDLISIGIVTGDGRRLYLENSEADHSMASEWVRDNVLAHLEGPSVPRHEIRDALVEFVGDDPDPVFWAYYGAYDWVALCQLFGTMMDLPPNFPKFHMDLKQWAEQLNVARFIHLNEKEHHALHDAEWTRVGWENLRNFERDIRSL
jgi:uncharacterized protein Usg